MKRKRWYARFGSISEATLKTSELIEIFLYELRQLGHPKRALHKWQAEYDLLSEIADEDDLGELLTDLQEALEEHTRDYTYFGTHEGDGACFGFWVDWRLLEADRVPRGPERPSATLFPPAPEYFLEVNDHGTCTLYRRARTRWIECWGCV